MPKRLETPCPERCAEFTSKGTNYEICLVCGDGTKETRVETPVYIPEVCPHDVIDRRGSHKDTVMIWCKQCCTYIDCRPRAEVLVQDTINEKMFTARSTIQKVAGRLLEKRNLTKVEVDKFYAMFGLQLRQYMTDMDVITQSKLTELVQAAIDI